MDNPTKDSSENTLTPGAVSPPTETDPNARTSGDRAGDPPSGPPIVIPQNVPKKD